MSELNKAEAVVQEAQDQADMLPINPVARRRSSTSLLSSPKSPLSAKSSLDGMSPHPSRGGTSPHPSPPNHTRLESPGGARDAKGASPHFSSPIATIPEYPGGSRVENKSHVSGEQQMQKQQQQGDHFASSITSLGSDGSFGRNGSAGSFGRTNSFGRTASGSTYDEDAETVFARFGTFVRCLEAKGEEKGGDEGRRNRADMDAAARWLVPAKLRKQAPPKLMTVHKIITPLKNKGDRTLAPDVVAPPAGDTGGRKSWFDAVAAVLGVGKDGMQEKEKEKEKEKQDHGNEEWLERASREFAESMLAAEEKSKEVIHAAEEKSKVVFQPVLEGSAHVSGWVDENITRPATKTVERVEDVVKEGVNVWVDENITKPATETVVKVEGAVKEGVKEVEEKGVGVWVDEHITRPATETVKEGVKEVGEKGVGAWIDERVGKPLKESYENMEGKGREIVQTVEEKSKEIVEKSKDFVQNAEERSREIVETVKEKSKEIVEKSKDFVDKSKDVVHDFEEKSKEVVKTVEEKRVEIAAGVDEVGRNIQERGFTPVVTGFIRRTSSETIEQAPVIVQEIEAEVVRVRNVVEETFPEQVVHSPKISVSCHLIELMKSKRKHAPPNHSIACQLWLHRVEEMIHPKH